MSIDINDPKLTAFALGELDETERAAIAAQVAESHDLQRAVEDIRATAAMLENGLKAESSGALSLEQRAYIEIAAATPARSAARRRLRAIAMRQLRWPSFWIVPAAMAATVLVAVGIGYFLPTLSRAREHSSSLVKKARSRGLVAQSGIKGIGTSGKMYANDGNEKWMIPPYAEALGVDPDDGAAGDYRVVACGTSPEVLAMLRDMNLSRSSFEPNSPGYEALLGEIAGNTEAYDAIVENPFRLAVQEPLSTFSIDVDTASYANVRRFLNDGVWPPAGAVRIEEMVNYFDYDYPIPTGEHPFSVNVEVAACPWNADHRLARIGLKGYEVVDEQDRPVANLVFLIDVSGSMQPQNKLPLLKEAMRLLVKELGDDDSVAIAVYAGASGLVLPSTPCRDEGTILAALDRLSAGGSTNGGAGIQLAYDTAQDNFIKGGINRVILATDGDFNVGVTDQSELVRLIEERAKSGVFLSVLGFGMGNYKDSTLEKLADKGNGNYAYIDTLNEARKVLVEQLGGTLMTIAKDVKIQIEFNPAEVEAYRLIGYENRLLAAQDFNDDTKDAGEIGAGHTVTALYEIIPAGMAADVPPVDPLKYQPAREPGPASLSGELMTVKLRYKEPDGDTSKLIEVPVMDSGGTWADSSDDFAFAASVASFGMLLRGSGHTRDFSLAAVAEMAEASLGADPNGYRAEFVGLVRKAIPLQPQSQGDSR